MVPFEALAGGGTPLCFVNSPMLEQLRARDQMVPSKALADGGTPLCSVNSPMLG